MKKLILISLFGFLVIGCASSTQNIKSKTASHIGGVLSDQVTITNIDRGMTEVKWNAKTPNGSYRCEADDMMKNVNCVKK